MVAPLALTFPQLLGITATGAGISGLGQFLGGQQQAAATDRASQRASSASRSQARLQRLLLERQWQLIMENAPIREAFRTASIENVGLLGQEAAGEPLSGPAAQLGLQRGSTALAQQAARFGISPDSSAFGRGLGDLTSQLTAADVNRQTQIRQFLAGLGSQAQAPGIGALGGQASSAGALSSSLLGQSLQSLIGTGGVRGAGTAAGFGTAGSAISAIPAQLQQFQLQGQQNQFNQQLLGLLGGGTSSPGGGFSFSGPRNPNFNLLPNLSGLGG